MSTIFAKLNLKSATEIVVVNAPASFEPELALLDAGVKVHRKLSQAKSIGFALAFATQQAELDAMSAALAAKATGDALLWFAYPKQSSKRYTCEFHRDSGWDVLAQAGFEKVRMVAIDEDWSGLRFRRAEYIPSLTRQPASAATALGKKRTAAQ